MILADTSVWIDHLRKPDVRVQELARSGMICGHPFVTGELASGSVHLNHRIFMLLRGLQQMEPVDSDQFFSFLEETGVNGTGLGFVDIHLLAAASCSNGVQVWTTDRRLREQAQRLGLAYTP